MKKNTILEEMFFGLCTASAIEIAIAIITTTTSTIIITIIITTTTTTTTTC